MFRLQIDIAGQRQFNRTLTRIAERIEHGRSAFQWIIDHVIQPSVKEHYDSAGARGGAPWVDYTAAERRSGYVAMKTRMLGASHPLLRWKGGREILYPSLVKKSHSLGIRKATDSGLEYGTRVSYAMDHHRGTGRGWRGKYTVPKRPLIVLTEADKVAVVKAIQAHAFGQRKAAA